MIFIQIGAVTGPSGPKMLGRDLNQQSPLTGCIKIEFWVELHYWIFACGLLVTSVTATLLQLSLKSLDCTGSKYTETFDAL